MSSGSSSAGPEQTVLRAVQSPRRMKKLLIVTELFHPSVGGQEIRYLELGGVFAANGWKVEVVTIGIDPALPDIEDIAGLSVHRLVCEDAYKRPNSRMRRNPATILKFAWKVRNRLRTHRYDVVIFNLFPLLPQIFAAVPRGTVALVDWCEHRSNGFWPGLNRLLSRSTDKHISVSEGVKTILTERYGIDDIACIPSGIFAQNYKSHPNKRGVLFFGRLSAHKRPEEAIRAVILARERGFTEHLTLAGGGPLADELKGRYGHLEFVRIVGRVSDEEKLKLLGEHRLYLLPSVREGFPRTVAEAMASGTPTITTNHPDNGTVDVVRQYGCGVVVEPGPESIAQAICSLTEDSAQWLRFSELGLSNSGALDWQCVYDKLIEHIGRNE